MSGVDHTPTTPFARRLGVQFAAEASHPRGRHVDMLLVSNLKPCVCIFPESR